MLLQHFVALHYFSDSNRISCKCWYKPSCMDWCKVECQYNLQATYHMAAPLSSMCKGWNKPSWTGAGLTSNIIFRQFAIWQPKQVNYAAPATQMLLSISHQIATGSICKSLNKPSWTGAELSSNHHQAALVALSSTGSIAKVKIHISGWV